MKQLIATLAQTHTLQNAEQLLAGYTPQNAALLAERARACRDAVYGKQVFLRGLIEVSNHCKNNCYYCGIRSSNRNATRYRLSDADILACCESGYAAGLRTFVLQGGEDAFFTDERLCRLLAQIKARYPDCAVTLSLGERSRESYARLFAAGADRYLLRHETADAAHYASLHPPQNILQTRLQALQNLKEIGYQVGCGFMVGSPGQTNRHLAQDLQLLQTFRPHMVGIGPFIAHKDTPFANEKAGSVEMTLYLLSIVRLLLPAVLLPATTALSTLDDGHLRGLAAGANVIMPNLTPPAQRANYTLYNNKRISGTDAAQGIALLQKQLQAAGYTVAAGRGDHAGQPHTPQ